MSGRSAPRMRALKACDAHDRRFRRRRRRRHPGRRDGRRAARILRRADGGDARADPARREAAASGRAADLDLAGRHADRRRLRRDAGDLRGEPRRVRPGAALHRRDPRQDDRHEGRDLPGALRLDAGGREGRAVHAAARADRLRHSGAPAGLARDRQSVRQRRSDRAAARDQAGRRAVPCRHGGPLRQRVHRPRPRTADDGACGGAHHRDRGEDLRRQSDGRSGALGRHRCRASMSTRSRSRRAAPGRCRCSITIRRTARIWPNTPGSPRPRRALRAISTSTSTRRRRREFPSRRAARRHDHAADRRRAACRGRQCLADPGDRRAGAARTRRRKAVRLAARQPQAHVLHRRRARAVRLRRPGPHRRVLPLGRRDRRRRQHQPGQHRRLRAAERAFPRLVRLGLSLLRGAEGHSVPPRAFAPHPGAEGVVHLGAGRQRRERASHRRADRAGHQPLPVLVRPCAQALPAGERASGPYGRGGDREHRIRFRPAGYGAGNAGAVGGYAAADARGGGAAAGGGLPAVRRAVGVLLADRRSHDACVESRRSTPSPPPPSWRASRAAPARPRSATSPAAPR